MNTASRIIVLFLFCASTVFAQNVRVDNVAFSSVQGFPFLPGATITVCTAAGAGVPCAPTVPGTCLSISDTTCNQSATLTSDAFGNYGFWIQPGSYTYTVTKAGFGGFGPRALTLAVPSAGTGPGTFTNLTVSGRANAKNLENARFVDNANSQGWAGANVAAWIDSAGADCGGNTCTVIISSDAADGNPTTPLANVVYLDYRPKGTGDGPNEVALNVWDGTAINNQAGSTGSYDRAILTCGRIIPATANKSFGCIRAYMFLPGVVMGADQGETTTGSLLFTQSNTDTITNGGLVNAFEPEVGFSGTGLSIYDIRGATINNIIGSINPTGTIGSLKFFDTQPANSIPSALHIQKWIGYNAENPAVPSASLTATGTVNCNNTATVAWVSGDKFTDRAMIGYPIVINGTTFTVATVTGGTSMTVNSATGGATTCPNGSGVAYTFAGNQYSEAMNGNVWLRADQSTTPSDSNGAGGIIIDTAGGGQATANTVVAIRDSKTRNADGTFKRIYMREENGQLIFRNQAFTTDVWFLNDTGDQQIAGHLYTLDGTQALPAMSFTSQNTLGFYRQGTNSVMVSTGNHNTSLWSQNLQRNEGGFSFGWSSGDPGAVASDTVLSRSAAGVVQVGTSEANNASGSIKLTATIAAGTQPTVTGTGTCATSGTPVGGMSAGSIVCTGTSGAATITFTFANTAPNFWKCDAYDATTFADALVHGTHTNNSCTFSAAALVANDVIVFSAVEY